MVYMCVVICINSFNSSEYMYAAMELLDATTAQHMSCKIMIAFGGCTKELAFKLNSNIYIVTTTSNLSDHNTYIAYAVLCKTGISWPTGRFVLLHDTCVLTESFKARIEHLGSLSDLPPFVFAHCYGLYNMGLATHDFMVQRDMDWHGINRLPKDLGIQLEQGADIIIEGRKIRSLHSFSNMTLSKGGDIGCVDTFTVQPSLIRGQLRYASFVSAFGVYKTFASKSSFAVPIFVAHRPTCVAERARVLRYVSPRLASNWAPLLQLNI